MKKNVWTGLLLAALCLTLLLPAAAETRQGVIALEGMEETIEETRFNSPMRFSFWYANDRLEAYVGEADGIAGVVVGALYSDDYMVLSMIPEEDAEEYAADSDTQPAKLSAASRVQMDVYRALENGRYYFLTIIAENGQYLRAVGEYSQEAAEGNAKFFQRVLDSVAFVSDYDAELLDKLPGRWTYSTEAEDPAAGETDLAFLTFAENGKVSLACYGADGGYLYTCEGVWSYQAVPDENGLLTLLFTATDDPQADSAYSVECVYNAYFESWVENDALITYLILTPVGGGASPFETVYGEDWEVAVHMEQGPNMRVVKCKEYVSLRETRSTSAKRLAKVPLGALVLAFPEYGEKNGFIYCVYHGEEGYILAEYLQPID